MKKENNKLQIQQETQVPDSGRSMVEMLGTLAVISVLSIGGIMGYSYAMKKYRSNQIANELIVFQKIMPVVPLSLISALAVFTIVARTTTNMVLSLQFVNNFHPSL